MVGVLLPAAKMEVLVAEHARAAHPPNRSWRRLGVAINPASRIVLLLLAMTLDVCPLAACERCGEQCVGAVAVFKEFRVRVPTQLLLRLTGDQADLRDGDVAVADLNGNACGPALADAGDEVVLVPERFREVFLALFGCAC